MRTGNIDDVDAHLESMSWQDWDDVHVWGYTAYMRDPVRFERHFVRNMYEWSLKQPVPEWSAAAEKNQHWRLYRLIKAREYGQQWEARLAAWRKALLAAIPDFTNVEQSMKKWQLYSLPTDVQLALYRHLPEQTREFLITLYSRARRWDDWPEEVAQFAKKQGHDDLYFTIYRNLIPIEVWEEDCIRFCNKISDDDELNATLRNHLVQGELWDADPVIRIAQEGGERIAPFLTTAVRELPAVWSNKWDEFCDLAAAWGETGLWQELVKRRITQEKFNELVSEGAASKDIAKLTALRGARGWSKPHPLTQDFAVKLYEFNAELAYSFSSHIYPNYQEQKYTKLLKLAESNGDWKFVVAMCANIASAPRYFDDDVFAAPLKLFRSLDRNAFEKHACAILRKLPEVQQFNHPSNLFVDFLVDDPERFGDSSIVVLLESTHHLAKDVAVRALCAPKRNAFAAQEIRTLRALLWSRSPQRCLKNVIRAIENAATVNPEQALNALKSTLELEQRYFPSESLIAAIGKILHAHPGLRSAKEEPVIYRSQAW